MITLLRLLRISAGLFRLIMPCLWRMIWIANHTKSQRMSAFTCWGWKIKMCFECQFFFFFLEIPWKLNWNCNCFYLAVQIKHLWCHFMNILKVPSVKKFTMMAITGKQYSDYNLSSPFSDKQNDSAQLKTKHRCFLSKSLALFKTIHILHSRPLQ